MENNNNETWFVLLSTYLDILEMDGRAWQEADSTAASVDYHFSGTIEQVMADVAALGDLEEDIDYGDDDCDDSMDGDHESALESVYGPNDGYEDACEDCGDF
jgi:hypothetical protein